MAGHSGFGALTFGQVKPLAHISVYTHTVHVVVNRLVECDAKRIVIDKDNTPVWQPARIEEVTPDMVQAFFTSPWATHSHPLRDLV